MESEIDPIKITKDVWIVPCRIDKSTKKYKPLISPAENFKLVENLSTRKSWSVNEDEALIQIIGNNGARQWSAIAIELNETVHDCQPVRKGKQCRERWLGHLNPKILRKNWTSEEDSILLYKQSSFGNHWSEITKFLPGRTENQIKNRWRKLSKSSKPKEFKRQQSPFAEVPLERMLIDVEISRLFTNFQSDFTAK